MNDTLPPDAIVYVVDDDEAVRDSLRWLLDAHGFRVAAYASAEAFLATLDAQGGPAQVCCLIADVRMPGMSGLELQDELLRRRLAVPLIFITGHGDVPMAVASMKKGAVDFLEKPFGDEQLRTLVTQCLRRAGQQLASDDLGRQATERIERLTLRERQVLDLIVAGRLNKQIADDLGISIKTVEAHRANIMDKLGARTMADLMKTALRASSGG
ncbi:MAG: response regulator [Burkholderiaceae bacterium]